MTPLSGPKTGRLLVLEMAGTPPKEYSISFNVDPVPYLAIVLTPDGNLIRANAAALEIFEAENESQVQGMSIFSTGESTLAPEDEAEARAKLQRGENVHFENGNS